MTLNEFVKKHADKPVDFDGAYGAQCVDLARQYFKEVWGFSQQPEGVVGAQDFFIKHFERPIQKKLCDITEYHAGVNEPPAGAVVIFKSSPNNKYGHIGICVEAGPTRINVFEQNGINNEQAVKEGRPQKGASVGMWGYERLLGWLTPRQG